MRPGALILLAMALLFLSVPGRASPIALMAVVLGAVGVAGLIGSALRRPELPRGSEDLEERVLQLEERLRLTEDELSAANRELSGLKEAREFDRELYGERPRSIPPGVSGEAG